MKVIDAVSRAPSVFEKGVTAGEYTHVPAAAPRAALVFIAGWETNAVDVSAVTYGGTAMTKLQENIPGTTPFPYTAVWLLDNVAAGPQVVKITKSTNAKVRVATMTINATGAVSKDAGNGGGGTNTTAGIPSLTAGGNSRFEVGINLAKSANGPVQRTNGLVEALDEGELYWEISGCELPLGGAVAMEWTWPEAVVNARSGVMLSVPGMVEPEGRTFNADAASGLATQWQFIPALAGRFTVVPTPVPGHASGANVFQFERRVGDPLVAAGNRCEAQSGLTYASGTERWFEFWRYVIERNDEHFDLFWQTHDQSGGSPPVCLLEEGPTLFFGPGIGTGWYFEGSRQPLGTWQHYKVFDKVHATEGKAKLWINGQLQTLKGGGTEKTGLNTIGEGPVYDKVGIYKSAEAPASAEPVKTLVGGYQGWSIEPPIEGLPATLAMVV